MYDGQGPDAYFILYILGLMDRALMRPISLIFYRYDGQGPHAYYILDILGMMDRALMRTISLIFYV